MPSHTFHQPKLPTSAGIKLPLRNALSVRTPAKSVPKKKLFLINPVGGSVDDGLGAVVRQLDGFSCLCGFNIDVIGPHVGHARSVRRKLCKHQCRWRGITTQFAQTFSASIENPVVSSRVRTPDFA